MITRFAACNWKNLADFDVALGRRVVLIGPNNCGKTNFFSGFGLLSDIAAVGFQQALDRDRRHASRAVRRGAPGGVRFQWALSTAVGFRGALGVTVELGFSVSAGVATIDHEVWATDDVVFDRRASPVYRACRDLAIVPQGLPSETQDRIAGSHPVFAALLGQPIVLPPATASALEDHGGRPGVVLVQYAEAEGGALGGLLQPARFVVDDLVRLYHSSDFALRVVASGNQAGVSPTRIRFDASDLIPYLRERRPLVERVLSWLRDLVPGLSDVRVESPRASRAWLEARIDGEWVDFAELSDGTVHALILATLLASAEPHQTLCIDEPELNLHPAWLAHVGRWIRESPAGQILVSTHSPELLDALSDGWEHDEVDVLVFEPTDHGAEIHRAEPERLRIRLDEGWRLGDMYRVGEPFIGGWPGVRWVGAPRGG